MTQTVLWRIMSAVRRDLPSGTVTFLFTDIEGSTKLLHELGSEAYAEALAEHRSVVREAFARHGGLEVDTQGDAFFVAFPRALDAVQAAVAAQRAQAAHPWPEGAAVRVRMGLHTGEPTAAVGRYVGLAVHRAARVGAAGHGGQVLLSETTHSVLRDQACRRLMQVRGSSDLHHAGGGRFLRNLQRAVLLRLQAAAISRRAIHFETR